MLGDAEFKEIGEELQNAYVSGIRKELNIPEDSRYLSSSFSVEYFQKLVGVIKEENITVVSASQRGDTVHLSCFISAQGIENVKTKKK